MVSSDQAVTVVGRLSWCANRAFLAVLVTYLCAAFGVASAWHIPLDLRLYNYPFFIFGVAASIFVFAVVALQVALRRPARPLAAVLDHLLIQLKLRERLTIGLPVVIVMPIFFSAFTSLKAGISSIVPYYADPILIAGDRLLHSADAWLFLDPLIGQPVTIFTLNFFYNLWFVVMFVVVFCMAFSARLALRSQYLISFVLTWAILGNVAATVSASVGPAFLYTFYGDPGFEPLIARLREIDEQLPIWALDAQEMLLASADGGPNLAGGISAFPSVHVGIATLNAVFLWRFGGALRYGSLAFLGLIQLGSVQLGWHYAVDGYFSILTTPIIWWVSGVFVRRFLSESVRLATAADRV